MHGDITYFEIGVAESAKAQAFYARVFGWEFPPIGIEDQVWIQTPSIRGGLHDQDPEPRIVAYFSVDDLDAAVQTVRDLGGTAQDPGPTEPGFGRFATCTDDQGVRFGLHETAQPRANHTG